MGTAAKQGSLMQRAHDKYGYDENGDDGDEIIIPVVNIIADSHGALEAVRDAPVSIGTESNDVVMARGTYA